MTLDTLQCRYYQFASRHNLLRSTGLYLISRIQTRPVPYVECHKTLASYREFDDQYYLMLFQIYNDHTRQTPCRKSQSSPSENSWRQPWPLVSSIAIHSSFKCLKISYSYIMLIIYLIL